MKAPEKLYINDFGSELSYDWHTEHCCESDIEYTRTDAFIEKAVEYILTNIPDMHTLGDSCKMDELIIEDFKNAMKL